MTNRVRVFVLALAITLGACAAGCAAPEIAKPGLDFYYLDQPDALTRETEAMIYFNNIALEEACGAQIAVVVVSDMGGMSSDEYCYRVINEWGVGDAEAQNGIAVLLAIQEDDYYVQIGAGIERFLDVSALKQMLNDDLEPHFARQDYDAGVRALFASLFNRVANAYDTQLTLKDGETLLAEFSGYADGDADNAQSNGGDAPVMITIKKPSLNALTLLFGIAYMIALGAFVIS